MFVPILHLSELSDGDGKKVDLKGFNIALFKSGSVVHAIEDKCPHEGAPLSEGFYDCGKVTCPLHAWEFDVVTGRVSNGRERVRVYATRITDGGMVEVDVNAD